MTLRILLLTENFPPEVNAAATRVHERACYWARDGHEVTVLTCFPNFPHGKVYPGFRQSLYQVEMMDGIRVIRLPTYIARNEGFLRRILDFLSFMLVSTIAAVFVPRPDVVISNSPQFFCAVAGWAAAVIRRRPFVFELADLWPASIAAVGAMSKGRIYRALEALELFLYRRAAAVVALTASFRDDLVRRGIKADKIHVVINGVDLARYSPRPKDASLLAALGLQGKFVLGYIGTQGMAHGLDNAVAAAVLLRDDDRFRLLFVGAGAANQELQNKAAVAGLTNVVFVPARPKHEMPDFWSLCDAALIHLKDDPVFSEVIPSKMFEAMAMGLPLLMAGPCGEASAIIDREAAGMRVGSADACDLACEVREWMSHPEQVLQFARSSLAAAPRYSRKRQADAMMEVLVDVVKRDLAS